MPKPDPELPADAPVTPVEPEPIDPAVAATMPNQTTEEGRPIPPKPADEGK